MNRNYPEGTGLNDNKKNIYIFLSKSFSEASGNFSAISFAVHKHIITEINLGTVEIISILLCGQCITLNCP